jgi:hypothetical protein
MEDADEPARRRTFRSMIRVGSVIGSGTVRSGRRLVQGLMRSVLVVEVFVRAQGVPKMSFVPYEAAVENLVTARLHPPLHDRVHPRHPNIGEHRLDTGFGKDLPGTSHPCLGRESAAGSPHRPGPSRDS